MKKILKWLVLLVIVAGVLVFGYLKSKTLKEKFLGENYGPHLTYSVFAYATTTGQGSVMDVTDYNDVTCSLVGDSASTMTIKFAGSLQEAAPTFTTAISSTNQYGYLMLTNAMTGATSSGANGVSITPSSSSTYRFDTGGLTWFTGVVTSHTSGTSTVNCRTFNE